MSNEQGEKMTLSTQHDRQMALSTPNRVAVIGAGTMGAGIAQTVAAAGIAVTMIDMDDAAVSRGTENIAGSLARLVRRGTVSEEDAGATRDRITGTTDFAQAA